MRFTKRPQHQFRQVCGVAENNDAVQIALLRIGGPFEASERRELSGDAIGLGSFDDLGPHSARQLWIAQLRITLAALMSRRTPAKVCKCTFGSGEVTPLARAVLLIGLSGFDIWLKTPMYSAWSDTM